MGSADSVTLLSFPIHEQVYFSTYLGLLSFLSIMVILYRVHILLNSSLYTFILFDAIISFIFIPFQAVRGFNSDSLFDVKGEL